MSVTTSQLASNQWLHCMYETLFRVGLGHPIHKDLALLRQRELISLAHHLSLTTPSWMSWSTVSFIIWSKGMNSGRPRLCVYQVNHISPMSKAKHRE